MSPSFIAATALAATSPTHSPANATGFLITCASAAATGFSESLGSRPLGRPKCASRMTLPPLPEISVMVGATRSSRVASLTWPFSIGTLRSTRSSTRLPFTSTSSRVRNDLDIYGLRSSFETPRCARLLRMRFLPHGEERAFARVSNHELMKSEQFPHRHGGVGHAIRKAPFIVIPRHHPHQRAVLHLGLVHVEGGRVRIVVEVDRDIGRRG